MSSPFIGSEALSSGRLTRGQLRWNYSAIHPDVYIANGIPRTVEVNTRAAALWASGSVITGRAAAALHGSLWIDPTTPIELVGISRRPRAGVVIREERIADDEITAVGDLRITTPARTALDLARFSSRFTAVTHLDALAAATGVDAQTVIALASRYPGARGIRRARGVLPLLDGGAQSPRESWLRMVVIDAGFPRPATQIRVCDRGLTAYIDMGWVQPRIGLEYDGDHHRTDRDQFVKDIARYDMLAANGWLIIRVVKEHSRASIIERVRTAFRDRHGLAKSA